MVAHLFYLRNSYNFLFYILLKIYAVNQNYPNYRRPSQLKCTKWMQLTKNNKNPIDVYRVKCLSIEQCDPKWPKLTKSSKIARSQLPKFSEVY